ncbi:MAG: helix-turn-helix domain-containing protein [Oscillospiraceae bacterium]|nr:helix-turn-helix domain-containing protein [Oscillospiraceae bacterium]
MAVFRIEKTRDYTVMSNYHLRDKRLSLKAKGLLSQMLSLPEDWDYTLTGLSTINRESKDAIRSAIQELEKCGYIERRQTTDKQGKFSGNEYVIHEFPAEAEESETEPSSASPSSENPTTGNPSTEKPSSENPTQLNIYKQNTNKQNTDPQSTESFLPSQPQTPTDGRTLRAEIRRRIEYETLTETADRAQVDELVEIMVEVAMNRRPTIKVGREGEFSTAYVQERFAHIGPDHIARVLDGIRENTKRVYNTKAYLLSALFNSVSTLDNHYAMLVNHDLHGGGM